MRLFAIGLAAAALTALSPAMALAADKKPIDDPKMHAQAMTEAPPLAQQAGLNCTPTDGYYVGSNKTKDATGKDVQTKYYELTCQEGLGFVVIAPAGAAPSGFDCLALTTNKPKAGEADKGQLYCRLPANADPLKGLQPLVAKAGLTCTVDQGRWMGLSTTDRFDQYEVSCLEGRGYVLQAPQLGSKHPLTPVDCITLEADTCKFFTKDKLLARVGAMAAPANRTCTLTDARWIGSIASNKNSYYEVACADSKPGYVLQVDANDKYVGAIDCARASSIAGGCTLTSASAAQTEELATYKRLTKEIGYPCEVSAYHSFGVDQKSGREVVELACSDHPDGAVALFPVDKGQTGEYFNCLRASSRGIKCALTPDNAAYARISAQIAAKGRTCQVSGGRSVGLSDNGDDFVEVSCTGIRGVMLEYTPGKEVLKEVVNCTEAKGIGGGCTLK